MEELHYYPFGMLMEGIGTAAVTVNAYKYNSKELNTDLGLNWSDYGARWYDASVGRWWSVDPMAEKYSGWSPYNYGINNPIIFIDPLGMEIINSHKADRDDAQKRLEEAQKKVNEYNGDKKSKEFKKINKEFNRAKNSYESINEKYEIVEFAIQELKEYNKEEYNLLNSLQDGIGNDVDVYIEATNYLIDEGTEQRIDGKTDVQADKVIDFGIAGSPERKSVATVKSKFGPNTAAISINIQGVGVGTTLAHEGGHAIYNVQNLYEYLIWLKQNPGKHTGHEKGNPSGERAYREEGIFMSNKKAKKQ